MLAGCVSLFYLIYLNSCYSNYCLCMEKTWLELGLLVRYNKMSDKTLKLFVSSVVEFEKSELAKFGMPNWQQMHETWLFWRELYVIVAIYGPGLGYRSPAFMWIMMAKHIGYCWLKDALLYKISVRSLQLLLYFAFITNYFQISRYAVLPSNSRSSSTPFPSSFWAPDRLPGFFPFYHMTGPFQPTPRHVLFKTLLHSNLTLS